MDINPFRYGNPVAPNQFIDRPRELRRLVGRITTGQSIAIVGEPRTGKTSLLEYLRATEKHQDLYGPHAGNLSFFYFDALSIPGGFTRTQFWEHALLQVNEDLISRITTESPLLKAYENCRENQFGSFVLERFFAHLYEAKYRLVLLLDEFDTLLDHPTLNNPEFFGGLRSLVSRSRGALVMVSASRQTISMLNAKTQEFNRTGSPYFNFLDELILGPFSQKEVMALHGLAGDRFVSLDMDFIQRVAGAHPYLLQVAASGLWDAYQEEENPFLRREQAGLLLYDRAGPVIGDTWRLWSPEMRKAFTAVALDHSTRLIDQDKFDIQKMVEELRNLKPELRTLIKQGYIIEDPKAMSGYHVRIEAFLWWLSEELVRTLRDDSSFDEWLRGQEWEGILERSEKTVLGKAAKWLGLVLKEGVQTFITSAAEGVAKGLTGV